jgi:hypothetical protein
MKRLLLLFVPVLCLPVTARADEASRRVKAEEMVTLLHMDTLMQQMMDTVQKQVSTVAEQLCDKKRTPRQQALVDDFRSKAFTLVESRMGWKAIEPEILDLYARNFTDDELDSILVFYRSPAGISIVAKLPAMTTQAAQISQTKMTALMPELKRMIQDFAKAAEEAKPTVVPDKKSQPATSSTDHPEPANRISLVSGMGCSVGT